jgi:Ca2+-binding RTX toxin-like protein
MTLGFLVGRGRRSFRQLETSCTTTTAPAYVDVFSPAVEGAFDAFQQHLVQGKSAEWFELTALKLRLVNFLQFEKRLHFGAFIGTYENPVVGTANSETLVGSPVGDLMVGQGGNDLLIALEGDGILIGGPANDNLLGGDGDDVFLYSGIGNGVDQLNGESGEDHAIAVTTGTVIGLDGYANGVDRIEGHASGDTIVRDASNSRTLDFSNTELVNIAEVDGGAGNDTIVASNLSPGTYRGGAGNDVFVMLPATDSGPYEIRIMDFQCGVDRIDLRQFRLDRTTAPETLAARVDEDDTLFDLPDGLRKVRLIDLALSELDVDDFLL